MAHELQNLERRHVAAELGRIATDSGLYGANRSRAALSTLFAWAIGEGLTDANPVVGTNKATEEVARDRVLTNGELSLIWRRAGEGDYGATVRLLILTGQRREEVGGMLWSEIDLKAAMWRIGGDRTKNARPHEVPLSQPALDILGARARIDGRALLFGARGPFSGWSQSEGGARRAPVGCSRELAAVALARHPPHGRDRHGGPWRSAARHRSRSEPH